MVSLSNPSLLLSILAILGHPGEEHGHISPAELSARQLSANTRHVQARACAPAMASMAAERNRKRAIMLKKRQDATATLTASTLAPSATAITNVSHFDSWIILLRATLTHCIVYMYNSAQGYRR
ncbi:hypothetical protein FRC02_000680 [Tulasnella sp. 418]|nr:hypothetical protein FRC02_000680 [Tulasnella sp. 418]